MNQKKRETGAIMHMPKTQARRVLNQHNIDCLTNGTSSSYCLNRGVFHANRARKDISWAEVHDIGYLPCDRCDHRNDMQGHPSRAFIGHTPQGQNT